MKIEVIDALVADGYNGIQIAEFDICDHSFRMVFVLNLEDSSNDFEVRSLCTKCRLDEHGAQLMGLNPENYCNDTLEMLV